MDSGDGGPLFPRTSEYHTVNIKLVLATVASLSFMILMLLLLHFYAKYAAASRSRSRRSLSFTSRLVLRAHPKPGLDPATLAALPSFVFKEPSGAECAVCLSLLEGGDAVRALPRCRHLFHVECIDKWFCSHATCPVCRAEVVPETLPEVWVPVAGDAPPPPVGGGGVEGEGCLNRVR